MLWQKDHHIIVQRLLSSAGCCAGCWYLFDSEGLYVNSEVSSPYCQRKNNFGTHTHTKTQIATIRNKIEIDAAELYNLLGQSIFVTSHRNLAHKRMEGKRIRRHKKEADESPLEFNGELMLHQDGSFWNSSIWIEVHRLQEI